MNKVNINKFRFNTLKQEKFLEFEIIGIILLASLLFRFQSVFAVGSVGWDEDSFFSMAQSIFTFHHVPYEEVLINPPPFSYLYYAPAIIGGAESIRIFRFSALTLLVFSGYLLSRIPGLNLHKLERVLVSVSFVAIFTLLPEGNGWLTELNSCVSLTILLVAVSSEKSSSGYLYFVGLVISINVLTRTNLAFSVIGIIIVYVIRILKQDPRKLIPFISGGGTPLALLILIYSLENNLGILFDVVVRLPFQYIEDNTPFHVEIGKSLVILTLLPLALAAISKFFLRSKIAKLEYLIIFVGTLFSVLLDQPNYGHHLLQLSPFIPLYLAIFISSSRSIGTMGILVTRMTTVLALCLISVGLFQLKGKADSQKIERGISQSFAESISPSNLNTLWAINGTYLYYSLGIQPIDRLVNHPNNLADAHIRNVIFDGISETNAVRRVLSEKPTYISISDPWYLNSASVEIIHEYLSNDYILIAKNSLKNLHLYTLKAESN